MHKAGFMNYIHLAEPGKLLIIEHIPQLALTVHISDSLGVFSVAVYAADGGAIPMTDEIAEAFTDVLAFSANWDFRSYFLLNNKHPLSRDVLEQLYKQRYDKLMSKLLFINNSNKIDFGDYTLYSGSLLIHKKTGKIVMEKWDAEIFFKLVSV